MQTHETITPAQITLLQTLRHQHPTLAEDSAYREWLHARARVNSTRDLTKAQARRMIEELKGGGINNESKKQTWRERVNMITRAQFGLLADILDQCGMQGPEAAKWARRALAHEGERRLLKSLWDLTMDEARIAIPMAQTVYYNYFGIDHDPGAPKMKREDAASGAACLITDKPASKGETDDARN
jgi:hypothetical protein